MRSDANDINQIIRIRFHDILDSTIKDEEDADEDSTAV